MRTNSIFLRARAMRRLLEGAGGLMVRFDEALVPLDDDVDDACPDEACESGPVAVFVS